MYHNTRKLSIHVEITNMQWLVSKWEFYFAIVLIFEKLRNLICSMNLPCYLPISFVNCVCVKLLSHVRFFATPWTAARQAPPSMRFSRQEYWSGLPFPSPGDLPDPGIEPGSPALQADALSSEPPGKPFVNWPVYISKFIKCQSKFWAQRINRESCDVINY